MKKGLLGLVCILMLLAECARAGPYFDDARQNEMDEDSLETTYDYPLHSPARPFVPEEEGLSDSDYSDNALDHLMHAAQQNKFATASSSIELAGIPARVLPVPSSIILYGCTPERACVRRGGNCDHRPNDCCFNSSCRCNLWGSNCRCQRMGLFQKWG